MTIEIPECKQFTGYKPCHPGEQGEACVNPEPMGTKILIINLGALGAVLMTTTILPALKRKFPESTIHWLTEPRAAELLQHNPNIDFIHHWGVGSLLTLQQMQFDIVCNSDKIQEMCALTNVLNAKEKLGYGLNKDGVMIPLNDGAGYNYRMGIDNKLKFQHNTRTYPNILRETFELDKTIDPYVFRFSGEEKKRIDQLREDFCLYKDKPVVGINTGCSNLYPNKKMPENELKKIIGWLFERDRSQSILLLGGIEDTERNSALAGEFENIVINTPTTEGLRSGMGYVDLCDIVCTGDSLGMHMAIGLEKKVIAWYNVTCAQEIEFYGRGIKLESGVDCSPCWKKICDNGLICYEEDISGSVVKAIESLEAKV